MTDPALERQGDGVLARLRRRKVVQWGIAYAAGAWGLLQGLAYVSGLLHWPERLQKLVGLALLIGLPMALTLAWYHGDRGEQRVTRTELAILTLLFLVGGGLFWRYQHSDDAPTASAKVDATHVVGQAAAGKDSRPSIAVLPFDNRSAKADDAFFVDGIHDDILTQLSKVSALKVISRTSVEQFRGTKLATKAIAQQLGVTSLLEGGVQRGGDRVRITVQLIDTATDAHLWAETYDRELTAANIFAIQSEVAEAIAGALKAELTAGEKARVGAVPTRNLEAWEAYQLGQQRLARRTTDSLTDAERFFRRAIELDPTFALAYAGLANALTLQVNYTGRPQEPTLGEADVAAAKALELDPNLAEAWAAKALILSQRFRDDEAEPMLRKALELNPNFAFAQHLLGLRLKALGRTQEWYERAQRAVELDPLSAHYNMVRGTAFAAEGRFAEAAERYRRAIEIDPARPHAYAQLSLLRAYAWNRFADAVPLMQKAIALDPGNPNWSAYLALLQLDLDDPAQATRLVAQNLQRWPADLSAETIGASIFQAVGDNAAAVELARKALEVSPNDSLVLWILRDADFRNGNPEMALARYALAAPELMQVPNPRVDRHNFWAAIDLALVLQRMQRADHASALLDRSEQVIREMPRLGGEGGYELADVSIYALRGDKAKALVALRDAEQAGWRGWGWRAERDVNPNLDSIRDEPEFKAVFGDIERDMAHQRAELAARPKDARLELGTPR